MLIEFSVNNFKSIKDTATFSMVSGSNNKMGNTVSVGKLELLPSAVIYGANASGKSNILEAFNMMRRIVLNQDKIIQSTDELPYNPFKLSTETEDASTSFDVVFTVNGKKYKYGFEYDKNIVYSEYLIFYESVRPTTIYEYDKDTGYKPNNKISEVKNLKKLDNSLYLWKADQEGYEIAGTVLEWFKECTYLSSSGEGIKGEEYSRLLQLPKFRETLTRVLQLADLGIKGLEQELESTEKIKTLHVKFNEKNEAIGMCKFDLNDDESVGTNKFYSIIEPILYSANYGVPIFIDELDANLHPILAKNIINEVFNNMDINKKHAQLIFTSQDTNLLDPALFHKSQIWFTEKDKYGRTYLDSLSDYKDIKQSENFAKNYILGKYGAIPYLGDFKSLLKE